jgi:hypothetical protein
MAINNPGTGGSGNSTGGNVTQGTTPWVDNITQIGGGNLTLGSKTSANSIPVVIASDQAPIQVTQVPGTAGGDSTYSGSIGNTTTAVKASAGQVTGWALGNNNTTPSYLQVFDLATGSVTLGVTAPKLSIMLPSNGGSNLAPPDGIAFATAISVAVTTTRAGATAPTNTCDLNILYK